MDSTLQRGNVWREEQVGGVKGQKNVARAQPSYAEVVETAAVCTLIIH